ncbi:SDR family NAD(P)-dependent oxidoreductase [Rhodococcus opacus]|uniref:SDR family NAD(P)-dependent oxidoreductase n=1 Tax=Rhodococcus TaxID=1827 RepID=UPI00146E81E9|nr:SDR family NAD(P)-dependent oxidoreductase [Rhodococcus sp. IEGM 1351]MDI9935278.1 SDR family NAD(P)-dependent oxidoreductase [Rhodococcus sp. IEGM 1351]WKN57526.1 SDR family NAD(P)-dependent oxidoreductase [Rhodococcus opacus]
MDTRVAIVTGAGSGIGAACAEVLADAGHHIIVADRDVSSAEKVASALNARSYSAEAQHIDIGDNDSIQTAFDAIATKHGRCDILVNNAGISQVHDILSFPDDVWEKTININLTGAFRCSQRAAKMMVERRWGRIVNISSISGIRAGVGRTAYGSAKAGVDALTRQFAVELGDAGITANAVAPGPIETPLAHITHSEETRKSYYRHIPLRRYGNPEEIAFAVGFLASEQAGYITGHTLPVDGGFVAAGLLNI